MELEFLKEVCTKVTIPVYADRRNSCRNRTDTGSNGLWGIRRLHHVGDDENLIEYELIRSNRKTLTIQVKTRRKCYRTGTGPAGEIQDCEICKRS